ncbi:MAG: cyclic nucleotide-binding domain-containing protein [bacterium]
MEKGSQLSGMQGGSNHDEIARLLAQVEIFSVLSEEEKKRLAALARVKTYAGGSFVVRQDTPGDALYIVVSGVCEVIVEDRQGHLQTVAKIQNGGFFGEMSLLTGEPSTATVRALEDSVLASISSLTFASILEANPEVTEKIGKVLAERQSELSAITGKSYGNKAANSKKFSGKIKSFFKLK